LNDISKKLLALRKELDLTQDQVAEAIGVSKQSISKYERGIKVPSRENINKLAEVFDVRTDYLLGKSERPKLDEKLFEKYEEILNRLNQLPEEDQDIVLQRMIKMTELLEEQNNSLNIKK